LSGYEDARRKGVDGLNLVECTKINKSIYAIHNVVYSLVTDTTRKAKSSTRPMVLPSSDKKNRLPGSVSSAVKKHTASQVHFSEKKTNCVSSSHKEGMY
jgi:hypothetical protein